MFGDGGGQGGWSDDEDDDRSLYGDGDEDEVVGGTKDEEDTQRVKIDEGTPRLPAAAHPEPSISASTTSTAPQTYLPSPAPPTTSSESSPAPVHAPLRSSSMTASPFVAPSLRKTTSTTSLAARAVPPAPLHLAPRHPPQLGAQGQRNGILGVEREGLYAGFPLPPVAPLSPRRRATAPSSPNGGLVPRSSPAEISGFSPTAFVLTPTAGSSDTTPMASAFSSSPSTGPFTAASASTREAEAGISPAMPSSTYTTGSPHSSHSSSPRSAGFPSPLSPHFSDPQSPRSATFSMSSTAPLSPRSPKSPRSPSAPGHPPTVPGSPRDRAGLGERTAPAPGRRWPIPRSSSHPPPTGPLPSPTLPSASPSLPTMPLSPTFSTSASRPGTGTGHSVQSRPGTAGSTHTMTSVATVSAGRPGTVASVRTVGSMQTTGSGQGLSGGEDVWDGAGDIYDDYMYRYSLHSMHSTRSGPSPGHRQSTQSGFSQGVGPFGQRGSTFSLAGMPSGATKVLGGAGRMSSAAMGAGSAEEGERTSEDQGLSESGGEKGGAAGHAVVSQSQSNADPIDPEARISLEKHSSKDSEDASRESDEDDAASDRTTDVDDEEGSVYSHTSTSGLDALQARFNYLNGDAGDNSFDDMNLRGRSGLSMLAAQARRAHAASSTSSSAPTSPEISLDVNGHADAGLTATREASGVRVDTGTVASGEGNMDPAKDRAPVKSGRPLQLPSPLLHTNWGDSLSSPEDDRRSAARSEFLSPTTAEFNKDGVARSPTLGGAASALRQRIEAQAAARARAGSDAGPGRIDGDIPGPSDSDTADVRNPGLGGRIVVEDDDPAPDVSLTTAKMGLGASADDSVRTEGSGMDPETSAISVYSQDPDSSVATVQGVEAKPVEGAAPDAEEINLSLDALSSAVESAGLAPLPESSSGDLTSSTSSIAPSSEYATPRPRPLQRTLAPPPPGGAERASLFMPHPNAPKAPSARDRSSRVLHMQSMMTQPGFAEAPTSSAPGVQPGPSGVPIPGSVVGGGGGLPPNHPGRGFGGLVRTLRAASVSRGVLGRGPTVYARCEDDLSAALGPVRIEFSMIPFVGVPPPLHPSASGPAIGFGSPSLHGQQHALAQELSRSPPPSHTPSPVPPAGSRPGSQLAPSPGPHPAANLPRHTPSPAMRHASPVPQSVARLSPSQAPQPNEIQAEGKSSESIRVTPPGTGSVPAASKVSTTDGDGDSAATAAAPEPSSPIPRANFFPRTGTARPRSRSFSEFRSSKTEVPMPMANEIDNTASFKASPPRRGSGLAPPSSSSQNKSPGPGRLRSSYAPSPLSIPPIGGSSRPPIKSPTSPLAQTAFTPSSPTTAVPPNSTPVAARPPHQLRQITSNTSLNDGDRDRNLRAARGPDSPSAHLASRRIASETTPSSPTSSLRPSFQARPSMDAEHDSRGMTSPQPPLPAQGATLVGRQSSLRSKLSLPNLRRKQSRQDETASIAASSVDGGGSEYELAQVKGLDFELVRPNIAQLHQSSRTSEDSAFTRDGSFDIRSDFAPPPSSATISLGPPSASPSSGLLRAESPAMSMSSLAASSQRSPSVAPVIRSSPRSGGEGSGGSGSESASMDAHRQRELKWMALLGTGMTASQARKSKKVKRLLLDGVPASVRYLVWSHLTDGKTRNVKGVYERLVSRGRVPASVAIERDAKAYLARQSQSQGSEQLKQDMQLQEASILALLQAYLTMVPDIQYTKGLTLIAGNMLLLAPEEDAFWIFVSMMDSHLRTYFAPNSSQMEVDATLFSRALESNDPQVAKKLLVGMSITPAGICWPWFSTLFVGILPTEYLDRVWDLFLYEGVPFLARVGLAIVTVTRRHILECTSAEAALVLLHSPPVQALPPTPDAFISLVHGVKLKDEDFRKQRVKMEAQVKRQTHVPRLTATGDISRPKI
ncbi:hypothetical protein HGRIS_014662 [Hohenbuehelia grisea]